MGTHAPEMEIKVDSETGVWVTDALPMLYVPRHFFINNHTAIAESLGDDMYAEILYKAGYQSAHYWCEKEAEKHGLSGDAVFEHYMKRLSQRGWGCSALKVWILRMELREFDWITRLLFTTTEKSIAKWITCLRAGLLARSIKSQRAWATTSKPKPHRFKARPKKALITESSWLSRWEAKWKW